MNSLARSAWNRFFGERGERAAARYLKREGMRILVRSYRIPSGEIDLIARQGDLLVFVEVKTRKQGAPAEAVGPLKQKRLTSAAMHFLKRHGLLECRWRFDIVAVVWADVGRDPRIEHIPNAFESVGRGQMFQ